MRGKSERSELVRALYLEQLETLAQNEEVDQDMADIVEDPAAVDINPALLPVDLLPPVNGGLSPRYRCKYDGLIGAASLTHCEHDPRRTPSASISISWNHRMRSNRC